MAYILPIKELKNTGKISELCHKVSEPVHITKNGYGDMVIMSSEVFEALSHKWQMYVDVEMSRKQAAEGQTKEAYASLEELRRKYGL